MLNFRRYWSGKEYENYRCPATVYQFRTLFISLLDWVVGMPVLWLCLDSRPSWIEELSINMFFSRTTFAVLMVFIVFTFPSLGQIKTLHISPIIVPATKPQTETIQSATVQDIAISSADASQRTLSDIIESSSGAQILRMGNHGSHLQVRGSDTDDVIVLLDGIPLNHSLGSTSLESLPLSMLSSATLYSGSQSAVFGSGATGGVLSLTSPQPGLPKTTFSTIIGSFETHKYQFSHEGHLLNMPFLIYCEQLDSKGDFAYLDDKSTQYNTTDDTIETRHNNHLSSFSTLLKSQLEFIGQDHMLLHYYQSRNGTPGTLNQPTYKTSQSSHSLRLGYRSTGHTLLGSPLEWQGYYQTQQRAYLDPDNELFINGDVAQQDYRIGTSFDWSVYPHIMGQPFSWSLSPKLEEQSLSDQNKDFPKRRLAQVSSGIEVPLFSDGLTLQWDMTSAYYHREHHLSASSLGFLFPVTDAWLLKGHTGSGFKIPSYQDLYAMYGAFKPNEDLQPELSEDRDIGILYQTDQLQLSSIYFERDITNLIEYEWSSGMYIRPVNIGKARLSGFENRINWQLAPIRFSYHGLMMDSKDQTGIRNRDHTTLIHHPHQKSSLKLVYELRDTLIFNSWDLFAEYIYIGQNYTTRGLDHTLPDRKWWNLGLLWRPIPTMTLQTRFQNIFNHQSQDFYGYPLPPYHLSFMCRLDI